MKTPLNVFYSTVQLLEKTRKVNEEKFSKVYDKYSSSLKVNSKRMLRIINNIVDTTRIDTGEFRADFGNYEIVSLVEDVAMSTVSFAKSKNISIEFDTNVEEHYIKYDPSMIEKIVLNLISNSIKYTKYSKYGGIIKIDIILEEKWIKILFEDNGIGIPLEMKDKIFDRFYRVDKARTRKMGGTGLGLAISKEIVEAHNGRIWANSVEGQGTSIFITLPCEIIEDGDWDE